MPQGLPGYFKPESCVYGKTGELYRSQTSLYLNEFGDTLNIGWTCIAGEFVPTTTPTPYVVTPTPYVVYGGNGTYYALRFEEVKDLILGDKWIDLGIFKAAFDR